MNRALGYIRVSKAREEMISPDLQLAAITDWCARNNTVLIDTITDLDATGRNFARKGVQDLLLRVEAGEADTVVVWKWSRFGRNVRDCLVNIDRLEIAGGRLVAATEDFDDSPVGRFGRGQFLLMAQFESERIGEQWKEAHARRIRHGLPANGGPRYGYQQIAGGYEIDPDTGPILAQMYRDYTAGKSAYVIAAGLHDSGIPGPQGAHWNTNTIISILDSGFGAGFVTLHDEYHPGAHKPVITVEEWEAFQRARRRRKSMPRRQITPTHPFAGLVRCRSCGWSMILKRDQYSMILRCGKSHRGACPAPAYVSLATLEPVVMGWLAMLADDVAAATKKVRSRESVVDDPIPRLTRQVVKLEKALGRLTRRYVEGEVSADAYRITADTLTIDLEMARNALQKAQDETTQATLVLPTLSPDLLSDWPTLDVLGQREILASLISEISVRPRRLDDGTPRVIIRPTWG